MPRKGEYKANATARSVYQRKYNSKPSSKKDRASRNSARRIVRKRLGSKAIEGKDIDHVNHNPQDNSGNLRVRSKSSNRADNGRD